MEKEIKKIISETMEISIKDIDINSNLSRDLEMESLDIIDLIVEVENKYNIEIKDKHIKNIQTVRDLIDYIDEAR